MKFLVMVLLPLLGACGATVTQERVQTVYVDRPIQCPSIEERARLRAARPARLRDQPMPPSAAERVARTSAQLGRYEAEGGWADQVDSALDRCQRP